MLNRGGFKFSGRKKTHPKFRSKWEIPGCLRNPFLGTKAGGRVFFSLCLSPSLERASTENCWLETSQTRLFGMAGWGRRDKTLMTAAGSDLSAITGAEGTAWTALLCDSFCKRSRSIFTLSAFCPPIAKLFLFFAPLKVRNRCLVSSLHVQHRSVVLFVLVYELFYCCNVLPPLPVCFKEWSYLLPVFVSPG